MRTPLGLVLNRVSDERWLARSLPPAPRILQGSMTTTSLDDRRPRNNGSQVPWAFHAHQTEGSAAYCSGILTLPPGRFPDVLAWLSLWTTCWPLATTFSYFFPARRELILRSVKDRRLYKSVLP